MRELILLRHALSQYNCLNRMQGQLDIPLAEHGHQQAQETAKDLAALNPLAIYSSDLLRAKDTALPLAQLCNTEVIFDSRLRETRLGQWEGMDHLQVDATWPGIRQQWRDDPQLSPPGGETKVQVALRGELVVNEIIAAYPHWDDSDRPVIVVSHGGFIAALTAYLLQLPLDQWSILGKISNTGWVVLHSSQAEKWRLGAWNRVHKINNPAENTALHARAAIDATIL